MSVVAEMKEVGPCRQQLSIEVPGPAVEAEVRRVVQTFRRNARIAGFRKGKVPESMVRQRYGDEIEKEVLDRLIPRYWQQASAERQLDPLLPPQVEEVDFEADDRLRFVATVEVRPEIELGNIEDFDLPDPATEALPEEIDEALERMRRQAGEWEPVERPAANGDLVEVEVRQLDASGEAGEMSGPATFEVGNEQVWPELNAAVDGRQAGATVPFERPAESPDGEERRFEATVTAVKEIVLAELDDSLAEKVAGMDSLDALRAEVERSIGASKRTDRRREREEALLVELRGRHPMALPQGVVDMEIEGLLREYAESLAARGVDVENAEIDWQELAEQIRPKAEERVHSRLLLDAVAAAREIEVTSEDLERALADLARAQRTSTAAVRSAMSESGQLERLRMQLLRHNTLVALMGEDPLAEAADDEPASAAGEET